MTLNPISSNFWEFRVISYVVGGNNADEMVAH